MKSVVSKKIGIFICILLFSSCVNKKTATYNDEISSLYLLDIYGDNEKFYKEDKDVFLVEKRIFVLDSCFGGYNKKNIQKAYYYASQNFNTSVYLIYTVKSKNPKTGLFQTLFEIEQQETILADIELRQGYSYKKKNENNYSVVDKKFLRVVEISKTGNLDFLCLNFEIDDDLNWTLIAKEKLNTSLCNNTQVGYCVDNKNKVLNLQNKQRYKINFIEAFFYTTIDWICDSCSILPEKFTLQRTIE